MKRLAPFLFVLLFGLMLFAAPAEVESPRALIWLVVKTIFKVAVAAALIGGAIIWYKKNKP